MNKTQKKILKTKLLKLLHITCYILSAIFLLVLIIGGVKSCNSKKSTPKKDNTNQLNLINSIYNDSEIYKYSVNYYLDTYDLTLEQQTNLSGYTLDLNVEYTYDDLPAPKSFDLLVATGSSNYFIDENDSVIQFDKLVAYFDLFETGEESGDYCYRLNSIRYWFNGTSYPFAFFLGDYTYENSYNFYDIVNIVTGSNSLDSYSWLFNSFSGSNFIFNKVINFNALQGLNLDANYGGALSWDWTLSPIYRIIINTGLFVSNGVIYDAIYVDYNDTNSIYFPINQSANGSADKIVKGSSGSYSYISMGYRRLDTGLFDLVNTRDQAQFEHDGTISYYSLRSSTWLLDSYRYITFLDNVSANNLIKIESFNNNNQTIGNGNIYTNSDVFILLGDAFTSLLPFWSINILPNISIGVLFFLPLVVGIIIIIVKMLRK